MFDNKYFMLFVLVLHSISLGAIFMAGLTFNNLPILIFPMAIMNIAFVTVNVIKILKRIK